MLRRQLYGTRSGNEDKRRGGTGCGGESGGGIVKAANIRGIFFTFLIKKRRRVCNPCYGIFPSFFFFFIFLTTCLGDYSGLTNELSFVISDVLLMFVLFLLVDFRPASR